MKKLKHSKYKNTGLIFNLLSNQLTTDILNNSVNESLKIIKKFFKEGTELHKELICYQSILNSNTTKEIIAQKVIEVSLQHHKRINKDKLNNERYNLIKSINENYTQDFFNSNVKNYKTLATIYKLFEYKNDLNMLEYTNNYSMLIESIIENKTQDIKNDNLSELSTQPKDIQQIAYNILVKKFNEKYKPLNESQKKLMNKYITENIQSDTFKDYVIQESINIKEQLLNISEEIKDNILKIKLTELSTLIDDIIHTKQIKENQLTAIIKYYELIEVINKGK